MHLSYMFFFITLSFSASRNGTRTTWIIKLFEDPDFSCFCWYDLKIFLKWYYDQNFTPWFQFWAYHVEFHVFGGFLCSRPQSTYLWYCGEKRSKKWFCNYQLINVPACIIGLWCTLYVCSAREKRQEIFPMTTMMASENVQRLLWKSLSKDHNDCFDNDRLDRLFYHVETGGRLINTSDGLPSVYVKVGSDGR